ncbi:DUF6119 family protein [Streptacidiphilus sp. MAP12-16]|uniref:DUF6119 family protein n=1 Tax=Streptacidiphilus sp. MAP12-16 TaxID=3156300 RepID=UPI00351858EE
MTQSPVKTRLATLFRLQGVGDDLDRAFDLFDAVYLTEHHAALDFCYLGDVQAAFIQAEFPRNRATWCGDAQATTGLAIQHEELRSGGVLLFGIDGWVYALGYGQGHLLIPEEAKDPRFGIAFVARRIGEGRVRQLVRRRPGAGRIDSTHLADGAPLWMAGFEAGAEIVRSLGGEAPKVNFSFAGRGDRVMYLEGGRGLRTRFGVAGADLVADVREIARVLREEPVTPGLQAVEYLLPLTDRLLILQLEADLDERLGAGDAGGIAVVPPADRLRDWTGARSVSLRIGSVPRDVQEVMLSDVMFYSALQKGGRRIHELQRGKVLLYSDSERHERTASLNLYKCLEVAASLGSRRFFLTEGHWYELDAAHLTAQRARIAGLFHTPPSLDLPAWDRAQHRTEREYNDWLPSCREGYINLDRKLVRNAMASHGSIEVCDHLAPDDSFVLVKRASGSRDLSHLYAQAVVAAKTLYASASARAAFAGLAAEHGRNLPEDFVPKKMVLAILHERGLVLTPDTMLPFSLTALAQTADFLATYGIDLEVIGISPADTARSVWKPGAGGSTGTSAN